MDGNRDHRPNCRNNLTPISAPQIPFIYSDRTSFSAGPFLSSGTDITAFTGRKIDLEGTVYRSAEKTGYGTRLYLETEYAISDVGVHHTTGKVIVSTAEESPGISYGDRLRIVGIKLRPITNFNNPGAFDVKKYYERQGMRAAGFVDGRDQIISFGRDSSYNPVIHYLDRLRLGYGNFVRTRFRSPENEILNALIIGDDGGIPPGVRTESRRRVSPMFFRYRVSMYGR